MSAHPHSPGPFTAETRARGISKAGFDLCIIAADKRHVAVVTHHGKESLLTRANASLLVAAPETLAELEATAAMLKSAMDRLQAAGIDDHASYSEQYWKARNAIDKARGGAR